MQLQQLTPAVQDYLKAIIKTELDGRRATTTGVAAELAVSPASVTNMAKRLASLELIERTPYRGFALTVRGRRLALEAIRHHRLLERYLVESLGLSLPDAHAEADRLEHALSERLEQRIDTMLGFPQRDPHGDPIPDAELKVAADEPRALSDLRVGEEAVVRRVPDDDKQLLVYLVSLGLTPGKCVRILAAAPFAGPITIRSESGDAPISRDLAATIGIAVA